VSAIYRRRWRVAALLFGAAVGLAILVIVAILHALS
jgi:hypothetical protein